MGAAPYRAANGETIYVSQEGDLPVIVIGAPDGRLFVAGDTNHGGLSGIYLSDGSFTNLTRLAPNLDDPQMPALSPDGTTVVFLYADNLWMVGIGGSNSRQFTDNTTRTESWPETFLYGWPSSRPTDSGLLGLETVLTATTPSR